MIPAPTIIGGSQNLRLFRRAIRDGASVTAAAEIAGMSIGEACAWVRADEQNPPPPEAFALIGQDSPPPVSTPAAQPQEMTMARAARKTTDDDTGVIEAKDFATAVRLFREDIKPSAGKVGEHAQEMSTAYKAIKKQCHIQPGAARLAFRLADMEDAKREDFLRCFNGLLDQMNIGIKPDLVDMAQGEAKGPPPVQSNKRGRPKLVTVPVSDGSETDLADAAGEPEPGTGAAARAAMSAAAMGDEDEYDDA